MICISKRELLGDENCIELRDWSHLSYKSVINYDLDITNILVVSRQIPYIEVFDITNPPFNEQIWLGPATSLNRKEFKIIIEYPCLTFLYAALEMLKYIPWGIVYIL